MAELSDIITQFVKDTPQTPEWIYFNGWLFNIIENSLASSNSRYIFSSIGKTILNGNFDQAARLNAIDEIDKNTIINYIGALSLDYDPTKDNTTYRRIYVHYKLIPVLDKLYATRHEINQATINFKAFLVNECLIDYSEHIPPMSSMSRILESYIFGNEAKISRLIGLIGKIN